jgi:hypothetical protein
MNTKMFLDSLTFSKFSGEMGEKEELRGDHFKVIQLIL